MRGEVANTTSKTALELISPKEECAFTVALKPRAEPQPPAAVLHICTEGSVSVL